MAQDRLQIPTVRVTMQGSHPNYRPPSIADYGTLAGMTASFHPLLGQAGAQDLSFSMALHDPDYSSGTGGVVDSGGGGGGGGSDPTGGSGGGGGGAGGGGGGGGERLPFTGLAVGAMAAVGSGLTAAGTALRRAVRERRGG
jgi:hypothetical protein